MSELSNVHSISNLSDELEQGKFSVDYIMDENKNCVGVSHPDWSFTIMRSQNNKSETAIVCSNTDEPFGILDSDVFNTILMSWLLIDDPKLIDEAKINDEWISVDDRLPDNYGVYLTFTEHGDTCVDYYNPTDNGESGDFRNQDNITHWKPLPQPPK